MPNRNAIIEEFDGPLGQALRVLSPHAREIRTDWRKLLSPHLDCREYLNSLMSLQIVAGTHSDFPLSPEACRETYERLGGDFARDGVPAECATLALTLYLEACIPYLGSGKILNTHWVRALTQRTSQCQHSLLSGYSRHASTVLKAQEDRTAQAERRVQEFSGSLAEAYETERRRLARDLHDEIGHDLIVLKLYIEVILMDLKKGETGRLNRKLKESINLIKHALRGVRSLTFDLGPTVWNEQGFIAAIRLYTRQFARRTGIKVRLDTSRLRIDMPQSCETALYRVLQGALSNVVAHAHAQRVGITVWTTRDSVRMKVVDNGRGFNVESKLHSYGLSAMRDRIELLGGTIRFASSPMLPGVTAHGSAIELHLPLLDPAARARDRAVDTALLLSFISRCKTPEQI